MSCEKALRQTNMKEILYLVMLKYVLVLACVVSFSQNVSAQKNIDSLRALVNKTTGIHKIDALNTLAYETGTLTTGESLTYSKEAYALSEKLNYDKGKALALLYMAYFKSNQGQLSEPRTLILQSVHLSHKIKEFEIEGYAYACLGQILRSEGKMDSVYFYSLKALQLLKSGKNLYYLSFLYNTLADYFQKEIQPDSQLFYAKKSWVVRQKLPDKNYLIFAGTRLADYYTLYQDFSMALAYLDSSQTTLKTDTLSGEAIATIWTKKAIVYSRLSNFKFATYFFNKAKQYYSTNLSPLELSDLLIEMTELYEDIGDYESSLKNGFEALSIVEKNNYSIEQTRALIRIAWSYYNLKQFKLSEKYNKEAITLAIKNKQSFELGTAYNLYGQISDSNEALVYYRKALAIRIRNKNISGQAEVYSNLGQFYFQHSRLDSAIYYHQLSLSLISKVHHTTGKAYALARIGQTYTALKNYPLASLFLDRAAHIADKYQKCHHKAGGSQV
jgi:tetratricopeptide (TPR) repeat protein